MYKSPLLHYRLKFIQSCKQRQTLYGNRATKQTASSFAVLPLSPAEAALRCREVGGERKRERAGHDGKGKKRREAPAFSLFPSFHARFLFFDYCYFYWDALQGGLCGGESCFAINLVRVREPGFHVPNSACAFSLPKFCIYNHCFQYLLGRM